MAEQTNNEAKIGQSANITRYPPKMPYGIDTIGCPVCKNKTTISGIELQRLKDEGKARPEMKSYLYCHHSVIADPSKSSIMVTQISTYYDVCAGCGVAYCVHTDVQQVMPKLNGKRK